MSFKSNLNYKGLQIQNAYYNINAVGGTKEKKIIELYVYASEELYNEDKINNNENNVLFIDTNNSFKPNYNDIAENEHKQAYEYLRANIFTNAVDC